MTTRSPLPYWSVFAAAAMLSGAGWCAQPTLTVAWRDKPPYHYADAGAAKGFLLERARQVFKLAEVPADFVSEPQKRIWANFKRGTPNYCSISWYKLPEREALAQYSLPFHEDLPQTILAAPSDVARVRAHATLESLLADPTLVLGVVEGVSYGPVLDQMIKGSKNKMMSRTVETTQMLRMLGVGRASFMFADREDWAYYRQRGERLMAVEYDLPGMPPGLRRHIVCGKDVPQETMDRLNKAIAATGGIVNPGHSIKAK